jgi:hypothetical protein
MTNNTQTQTINGHKVTIGYQVPADNIIQEFPWIQIDDSPKYFVDTDGDHWGSIGIDNPEVLKDTILSGFVEYNEYADTWVFDMGGQFNVVNENNHWEQVDYNEIIEPLGLIDNYNGAYGNG